MKVEIVTPVGESFVGEAVEINAPGSLGEVGILPRHRDMLTALGTGVCRIRAVEHGEFEEILLDGGYLQVSHGGRVIIVTELSERKEDVDVERVTRQLEVARKELDGAHEHVGKSSWQVKKHAVDLAEARLSLVRR